jgi:hypothetical protein
MVMAITISRLRYFPRPRSHADLGTWFTYAVMQIFFGGFSGLESKPVVLVDMNKEGQQVI